MRRLLTLILPLASWFLFATSGCEGDTGWQPCRVEPSVSQIQSPLAAPPERFSQAGSVVWIAILWMVPAAACVGIGIAASRKRRASGPRLVPLPTIVLGTAGLLSGLTVGQLLVMPTFIAISMDPKPVSVELQAIRSWRAAKYGSADEGVSEWAYWYMVRGVARSGPERNLIFEDECSEATWREAKSGAVHEVSFVASGTVPQLHQTGTEPGLFIGQVLLLGGLGVVIVSVQIGLLAFRATRAPV